MTNTKFLGLKTKVASQGFYQPLTNAVQIPSSYVAPALRQPLLSEPDKKQYAIVSNTQKYPLESIRSFFQGQGFYRPYEKPQKACGNIYQLASAQNFFWCAGKFALHH